MLALERRRLVSRLLSIPANAIVDRRLLPVLLGLASAFPFAIDDRRCWSLVLQPMVELIMMVVLVLVVLGLKPLVHAQNRCRSNCYRVLES